MRTELCGVRHEALICMAAQSSDDVSALELRHP